MGLFSLKSLLNLTNSAMRLSISLLTSACRFWVKRRLSSVTKAMKAGNGSAGGLSVGLDTDPEACGAGDGSFDEEGD